MPQLLIPMFPAHATPISEVLSFVNKEGMIYYFHGCLPIFCHGEKYLRAFRYFTCQLVESGSCRQVDIVRAFGISAISMKRWVKKYRESDQFLILMPKGWTREKSSNAKDAWGWLQKNHPSIARHLAPFSIAAQKRYDKGEYWRELRACDYYQEFEKPKIIYPNIVEKLILKFLCVPCGLCG
jgi:hypothetical protein